jgi:hypothetical protein
MNQLEYTLIDSNQRTATATATNQTTTELIDHFLNHRWNSVINHNLLRTYFNLDQQYQLTLTNTHQKEEEPLIKLSFIATLLSVYVQINYTGPTQFEYQPISILNQTENQHQDQDQEESELNSISLDALSLAGEPAYHLAKSATYLLMAIQLIDQLILTLDLTQFPTIVWWKLRAEILRRQLFDQPIPLSDQLLKQIDKLSSRLSSINHSSAYDLDLLPMLTLERGLAEHLTGNEKAANILFRKAVTQAKLECKLSIYLNPSPTKDVTNNYLCIR